MPTDVNSMKNFDSFLLEGMSARACARFPVAAVALAALTLAQSAVAQDAKMATTVVTATRTESRVDETLADVTVITSQQIQHMAPSRSVAEVLQRFAGVQIASNGGRGNTQSVFIRGNDANKTLLLVDGVRYGSATMGAPALENLPLELIDRIEVVRGPASALYGSDAIGGVIQIFTKRGQGVGKPFLAQGAVTVGEYGHKSGNVGLRGEQAGFDYHLNISRVVEHGISASNARAGMSTYNPDRDAFDQTAANLGVGYAFNADWRLDTTFMNSEGRAYSDGGLGSNPYADLRTQAARVQLTGKLLPQWTSRFSVGQSKDKQINLGSSWGDSHFNTRQTEYKWDNEIATPVGKVLAGLERLEQKVDTSDQYAVNERSVNAAFVGLNGGMGRHSWQVNLRRDDNSQYGGFTTYGASYGYEVVQGVQVYASHGKSMRAPSFNDLYYPSPYYPAYNGNPLLQPEQGKNNEIGVQWTAQGQRAKLLHFDNRVTNLIQGGVNHMENVAGTTRLKGWHAEYGFTAQGWNLSSTYDYLDPKTRDNKPLSRRAKHQATLNLDKQLGAWKLGGGLLYVGNRKDQGGMVTLDSYTTVDLYAEYQIKPEWSLQARVANVGNKHYETAYGYNQLGRAGYLTLKWAPR